jgi:hypothetical protein
VRVIAACDIARGVSFDWHAARDTEILRFAARDRFNRYRYRILQGISIRREQARRSQNRREFTETALLSSSPRPAAFVHISHHVNIMRDVQFRKDVNET